MDGQRVKFVVSLFAGGVFFMLVTLFLAYIQFAITSPLAKHNIQGSISLTGLITFVLFLCGLILVIADIKSGNS